MGGWASILFFCSGRAGGRRDFVVENRVGVGGRPGTPGPVGGPDRYQLYGRPAYKSSSDYSENQNHFVPLNKNLS